VLANFALGTAAGLEKALSVTTLSDFTSWSGFRAGVRALRAGSF